MRTTSSISFYCRKSKANREGYSPLECSVTISGSRKFLNLPLVKFKAEEFNKKKPSPEILEVMDLWRNRINDYMVQMMREGMVITAETLRQVIQEGGVRAYTVGRLFDDYLLLLKKRVGVDLKHTVYRKYELTAEKALKFVHRDADITKLTPHLIQTIIVSWRASFDASTLAGYLTRLKCFIRFALDNGKLSVNPFQGVRISKPIKPIKALNEEQVMDLLGRSYKPRLQRVLDLFLVSCATGMAYSDLMDFKFEDLKKEGEYFYISKARRKTGREFNALVLPFGVPIILHYGEGGLPRISNQVYNRYLKEISPSLTTHMGRRTYATYLANKGGGLDIGTIAAALGDTPQIAARYYARIQSQTIIRQQISILKGN